MIDIQSPTRVDLAGGTLDCWPLHLFVGDCVTVNLAIDIMTGCVLRPKSTPEIEIEISDLHYRKTFSNLNELLSSSNQKLLLVQKILEHFRPTYGFHLRTASQSPVGGGLGGSSSLCISLIKALSQMAGVHLTLEKMVELAHNLEAKVIKSPTGTQDYIPALLSGLNIIHYTSEGMRVESLEVPLDVFSRNMLLVYTGKSHHSGINNWQVIKSVIEGDENTLHALQGIARISSDMAEVCRRQEWDLIPELFRSEFDSRIKLTSAFSSPEIEKLKKLVADLGSGAVKICGAGGGGCVIIWAEPQQHERIRSACEKSGFRPLKARPFVHPKPN